VLFNSLSFALFFAVVYAGTLALRHNVRARNVLLLVASYFFYGSWDWRFLSLIWLSTLIDYCAGIGIERAGTPAGKRRWLVLSLVTNLSLLGVFKYLGFFADSFRELCVHCLGWEPGIPVLTVVLPVGISFYTFQTLSYTIDIYLGKMRPTRNILDFALFVAFFPQLVAGPIERASSLLGQLAETRPITDRMFREGAWLIFWGLFKKVVIADNCALVVDAVYAADPSLLGGGEILAATYAFAAQIYCDFSGYSDIARGTAKMMGFELCLNFDLPYFAVNPSDFWRRWHISLSTWLRDYLYIPLGGNRKGIRRTYINLMATMLLGGLWHGAAWHFVIWGAFHGLLLCGHRLASGHLEKWFGGWQGWKAKLWWCLRILVFFQITCVGWLLFRVGSVAQIVDFARRIGASPAAGFLTRIQPVLPHLLFLAVWQAVQYRTKDSFPVFRLPGWARALVYVLLYYVLILFGRFDLHEFIYFQF
jgi:D-alanyl-lipoteichoic acid acyltransferase DltB (MBOAT superfamily)